MLSLSCFSLISTGQPGDLLPVKTQSEKLIQLKIKVWLHSLFFISDTFPTRRLQDFVLCSWQGNDHVCSSVLSPCGSWLAYSTLSGVRLYRLQYNNISITKVGPKDTVTHCCYTLLTGFSEYLYWFSRCPNSPRSSSRPASSASPRTPPDSLPPPVTPQWLSPPSASWSANTCTR